MKVMNVAMGGHGPDLRIGETAYDTLERPDSRIGHALLLPCWMA